MTTEKATFLDAIAAGAARIRSIFDRDEAKAKARTEALCRGEAPPDDAPAPPLARPAAMPSPVSAPPPVRDPEARARFLERVEAARATAPDGMATVATPDITPEGGAYSGRVTVDIACSTADAKIYFTRDGSDPDEDAPTSEIYTQPFDLNQSCEIRARGYKTGMRPSNLAGQNYTIKYSDADEKDQGLAARTRHYQSLGLCEATARKQAISEGASRHVERMIEAGKKPVDQGAHFRVMPQASPPPLALPENHPNEIGARRLEAAGRHEAAREVRRNGRLAEFMRARGYDPSGPAAA